MSNPVLNSPESDEPLDLEQEQPDEPFDLEQEPLDPPPPFEVDWGGDGSDLSRPVRAHVLAALRPVSEPYQPPLDALLTWGELDNDEIESQRLALGIGQAQLPELLTMVRDRALYTAPSDSPEVWAPLHALYILSQLDLGEQLAELMPLFDVESDWLAEDLPRLMGAVGASAIAPLQAYLEDTSRYTWGHARAAESLQEIGAQYPELREQVIAILGGLLDAAERYGKESVTGLIGALIDLDAVEALPTIRRAFELDRVDEAVYGPWGEVLTMLGQEPEADDPLVAESLQRFNERHVQLLPTEQPVLPAGQPQAPPAGGGYDRPKKSAAQARKVKNKRKTSKAARKNNSRKKKRT